MPIRPLDLRDLPVLGRYRNDAITLDSGRALTRGHPLSAAGFLSYFNPARHIYGAQASENGEALLGGIIHTRGETFAKLLYLAPASRLPHPDLPLLIEHLAAEAGSWGAFHVMAEADESSPAFPALRTAGFSVYVWQRMWEVSSVEAAGKSTRPEWRRLRSEDLSAVQSLYHQIVPPLLQPVEPLLANPRGFISTDGMKCYAGLNSGRAGILLTPLIHPEETHVGAKLAALLRHLPSRGDRPAYICVRSYQAWLEPVLADLGARAGDRQAVMVKHLARLIKEEQSVRAAQPAGVTVQPSRVSRMQGKK
ncbi:MAG TPA: hypothetical protein VGJ22_09055 [Anaerolineales bacterium]|jgi:hypothetical protein